MHQFRYSGIISDKFKFIKCGLTYVPAVMGRIFAETGGMGMSLMGNGANLLSRAALYWISGTEH